MRAEGFHTENMGLPTSPQWLQSSELLSTPVSLQLRPLTASLSHQHQGKKLPSSLLYKEGGDAIHSSPSLSPSPLSLCLVCHLFINHEACTSNGSVTLHDAGDAEDAEMKSQAQPTCNSPSRENPRPVSKSLHSTHYLPQSPVHMSLVDTGWF